MNIGRRIEHEIARIHLSFLSSKGVKDIKLSDLMVHEGHDSRHMNDVNEPSEDDEAALHAYMMANVE